MRRKVMRAVKDMGYQFRSSSSSNTIGFVCGSLELVIGRYLSLQLNILFRELKRRGYKVMILSYEDIDLFNENMLKGVISIDIFQRISYKLVNLKNLQLVCLNDSSYHLKSIYSVRSDQDKAMLEIVEHLAELNHRRIVFLQYFEHLRESKNINYHRDSFINSVNSSPHKISPFIETFTHRDFTHEAIGKLLLHDITALIVRGVSFTPCVRHSLELYRKRIPDDISVVTDDEYSCRYYIPGQTTMAYNFPELSRQAVNMLEDIIDGRKVSDVKVDDNWVKRGSTGPKRSRR